MNRVVPLPESVKSLCQELDIEPRDTITFPISDYLTEHGGIITSDLVAIALPNAAENPHRLFDVSAQSLAALGSVTILGVWHTHTHDSKPSVRDHRTVGEWAREGVPLFVTLSPRREWFWITDTD